MNKFKIALASFLIVNSFTMAETLTDFQKKAVKDLYNKGILQTIVKEEDFDKKDNFSRGEIATIIYNTVNYKNSDALKSASEKDIIVLKALISDFSSELAKLGAADYELIQLINEEKNIVNKRIDKEVLTLNDKIDRIKLSGDVTLVKEFDTSKDNPEFFNEMKGEGEVRLDIKISDEIKAKASYDFDREMGEYALDIKNPSFNLSVFNDESLSNDDWKDWTTNLDSDGNLTRKSSIKEKINSKKIPNFSNAMGIVDKAGINNLDTIVINKKMPTKDLTALVTSTENEDIYGFEYKSKMKYFMSTPGSDANMLISQVFLNDKDDKDTAGNQIDDRRFLILGADFLFPINGNANQTLVYNYSKMRPSINGTVPQGTKYFLPIVDDEATLVDAKTDINSKKYGKIELTLSGLNTGAKYNPIGLSDSEREIFAKTDKIKLAQNIFGGVLELKNTKGYFENTFSSITYKKNDDSEIDTTSKLGTLYSLKDGKTKVGLSFGQNTDKDKDDSTATKYTRNFTELELQLKDKIKKDTKEVLTLNLAKEKITDKDEMTIYGEHKETRKNSNLTLAAEYKDTAVENTMKTAIVNERSEKLKEKYNSNILVGGKYEKDLDDKTDKYAVFTKFDVQVKENISIDGGLRYSKGRTINNGTTYAAGVSYNLSKDSKISAIYGPVDVLNDYSSDIFDYKTDGIYGDDKQNIGSLKVSVKF